MGVRVRLDNGISGFIANKNISDKGVKRPEDRAQVRSMIILVEKFKALYSKTVTCDARSSFSSPAKN